MWIIQLRHLISEGKYTRISKGILLLEYLAMIIYLGVVWLTTPESDAVTTAQGMSDIIFLQFFAQFLTVLLGVQLLNEQSNIYKNVILRLVIVGLYGGFGLWIMLDLTDETIATVIWVVGIITAILDDHETALAGAFLHGGWIMLAAFLAAFVGSMFGVDEESLLATDLATAIGWGMIYYAGLAFYMLLILTNRPTVS